jgi:hypothetical protein
MFTPLTLPKDAFPTIAIDLLVQRLKPAAVYAFGYACTKQRRMGPFVTKESKKQHFDLLVFCADPPVNASADVGQLLFEQSGGEMTVALLIHNSRELKQRPGNQQYFFYNVLQTATRLFIDKSRVPYMLFDELPVRHIAAARAYWENSEAIAALLIEAAETTQRLDVEKVRIALLHQAVQHLALGLIRVGLGYKPNHFHLGFLFDLCEHCCSLTQQLFPRQSEEDLRLFRLLATHPASLRHSSSLTAEEGDFVLLLSRAKRFLAETSEEVLNFEF